MIRPSNIDPTNCLSLPLFPLLSQFGPDTLEQQDDNGRCRIVVLLAPEVLSLSIVCFEKQI